MRQTKFSAETGQLDQLISESLKTACQPDPAMMGRLRYELKIGHAPRHRALLWLPALCGTVMTASAVFAITLFFPNPPWKQIILALGCICVLSAWLLTLFGIKYNLFGEGRNMIWQ